jgi:glyoxylase-like metal-dependent hydrolase (beta-lactamase superfamily II)
MSAPIHHVTSAWGRVAVNGYVVDAPELTVVDTGIAPFAAEAIVPALEAIDRRVEDVRWILLTHGHIDHVGGAHALWELTGRSAQVVIHEADAPMLRSRRAHVQDYLQRRGLYLNDPEGEAKLVAVTEAAISGELEPTVILRGGETLSLGGDVTVSVHPIPGHCAGAVAYVVNGQNDVFVGDSVEMYGAASGFPSYDDPDAYRASLTYLRDEIRPQRLFLGHPYRHADGETDGVELDREQAQVAIAESLENEARIRLATERYLDAGWVQSDSPHSPFAKVAEELGYTRDPTPEPSPFFTTMHGYRTRTESLR